MEVNIKEICGNWKLGYSLDKHTISSTPIGHNQFGHMQFDTVRPEVGEALFQLKYRSDFTKVLPIAQQLHASFGEAFSSASLVVPMPPSKNRNRQPVIEIARELARLHGVPCYENLLVKTKETPPLKDAPTRAEKLSTIINALTVYDVLETGLYDILLVDDLYDTGASLEAATTVLRNYAKIQNVFVATVTRKR